MKDRKKVKVLFVCMGNICRSPTAHGVFRGLVENAGLADVIEIDGVAVTPEDYVSVGGLQANQLFNGFIIFGDDGTNLTLTRGTGSDLGNFINEGFFGASFGEAELFSDVLTFGDDGTNLTLTRGSGDFAADGFVEDQMIRVDATGTGGFSENNGDYEILSVSTTEIILTALVGTDPWVTTGTTTDDTVLSELVPIAGQSIRIGGSPNDGDYEIALISGDGQTITLTTSTTSPWTFTGESDDPIVLSDLAKAFIFEGEVTFGEETNPDFFPGQFIDRGLSGEQAGWLSEGFLEGMWVRISDVNSIKPDVEAKIQLIRGDNDSKDAKLQLINVTIDGVESSLNATWLGDLIADNVQVVRIAPTATFTSTDYYDLQTIELQADDDYIVPPTREGVKIFPVSTHLLSKLCGPLAVEGGPTGADRSLTNGVKLPGEKDDFLIVIGAQPPESQQIDVLNIFNDSSQADGFGTMTETTLRGFGMADDLNFGVVTGPTFGEGESGSELIVPGGISFGKINFGSSGFGTNDIQSSIEVMNLMLGEGNDFLDVSGTLNPAPFVSAQNAFISTPDNVDGGGTISFDGFDWKAQGFLPGQEIFIEGFDGQSWTVVEVRDASEEISDGMGGTITITDPNDNSIMVLSGPTPLPVLGGLTDVLITAVDALVNIKVPVNIVGTADGIVVTRLDLNGDWEEDGFLEGHLIGFGGFDHPIQYRVLEIDGASMKLLGETLANQTNVEEMFWVQGTHGGLTVLHGGGNLFVETIGNYDATPVGDDNIITRLDGRSWQADGYEIGQIIQVGAEGETRTILGFADATLPTPDGEFATWGTDSAMIVSGDPFDGGTISDIDLHLSVPERVETTVIATLIVDRLTRESGSWIAEGFEIGQVIYIEGIAGGFTIAEVTETQMTLKGAAISGCAIEQNAEITVFRIDVETDTGSAVGGDHFVIRNNENGALVAGPNSPLIVYGDTSQDGAWYSGRSFDRLGQEFGEKPFDPFPQLPDDENEDNEWVFPLANPYSFAGNDIIDASGLFAGVATADLPSVGFTAYGGAGNDLIIGSQAGDHLAGGSGDDTILGQRGVDHIYGDSGVNVDILTRALDIPTIDTNPAPTIDPNLGSSDQTFAPVRIPFPISDNLIAGQDFLEGDGRVDGIDAGTPDVQNVIFADHGEIVQLVQDPNEPPVLLQKIQTTALDTILEINALEPQNGADDTIFGTTIADILIGGPGDDMIDGREGDDLIFGDLVNLSRMSGDDGIVDDGDLIDDILNARFQTLAGTLIYARTDRPLPDGVDPLYAYDAVGEGSLHGNNAGRLLTDGILRDYRDPNGPQWWAEYEIDYAQYHTFEIDLGLAGVGSFGNDYIAGGADHDTIFGQLGNDVIQGDGSIDDAVAAIAHVGAARDPGDETDPVGPLTVVASFEAVTDGEDYIEGGGGCDVIMGGLGQDDIVGGSSTHFSLVDPNSRPDTNDMIFGGAGTQIGRNNGFDPDAEAPPAGTDPNDLLPNYEYGDEIYEGTDGTPVENRHARDSDVIAGDNSDIIRLVGIDGIDVNGVGEDYLEYNYDQTSEGEDRGSERIIVRGVRLLDYTAGGPDFKPAEFADSAFRPMFGDPVHPGLFAKVDIGGNDEVHGGTGDDFIYLGGGNDAAFGDADDDDIIGGWGHDWISGGTGIDGILGDDGRIFTSRNTSDELVAESLYGVEALVDRDPDTRTSQGDVLNELIRTPGNVQTELINVEFELKKSVDLTPYNPTSADVLGGDPHATDISFGDDIVFGGLGNDFIHGGSGDDAIAGGEALPESYSVRIEGSEMDELGQERDILGLVRIDFTRPYNPGNVLLFGDDTNPWNSPKPVQGRIGEFYLYDEYDPRRPILFDEVAGETIVWNGDDINDPDLKHYFLNQAHDEGLSALGYIAFNPDGQTPDPDFDPEFRQSDGDDVILGDLGNDWIVGGTGRDHIYGGFGNDLMNADDVLGTENPDPPQNNPGQLPLGGYDETPDTHWLFEDRVFGGGGLDILIGNTKGDRLIDWVGEFNSYIVPFAPFGVATVSRQVPPHLFDFLYAQAFGDGVDITRTEDTGTVNHKDKYSNVALIMGGVEGEIGLVTQKDHGYWQDQTGGPTDPQAGNVPGGRRDVLRTSDFNNGSMDLFIRDTGKAQVVSGQLQIAAESKSTQVSLVYNLDEYLPIYYEVTAKLTADKPTGGYKANAYVIFDYQSDIDFKYAGINISNDKIEMGYRDATGWHEVVQSNEPVQIKPEIQYNVLVAVNGTNVTLVIDGVNWFTYTFDPQLDEDGLPIPLNKGFVGVGMNGGSGKVDNFTVQVLPPEITLEVVDDFSGPDAAQVMTPVTGVWELPDDLYLYTGTAPAGETAVSLADLGTDIAVSSILELEATMTPGGLGGLVFDYYGPSDFKFVTLDAANDQILVGHVDLKSGLSVDQTYSKTLDDNQDNTLKLSFRGAAVSLSVNNSFVDTYGFNAALVDGEFGLVSFGTIAFDEMTIRTNDPAFPIDEGDNLMASAVPQESAGTDTILINSALDPIVEQAIVRLAESYALDESHLALLDTVNFEIVDFEGLTLGYTESTTVLLDLDAAGYGWFIDSTPWDDAEFSRLNEEGELVADSASEAYGDMDLLTVVMHELGHVLGLEDLDPDTHDLMSETLDAGVRQLADDYIDADSVEVNEAEDLASLVVMDTAINEAEAIAPAAPAAAAKHGSSWLTEFLTNGTGKRYNKFDPKDDIKIVLFDDDEENN